jgi:outer membrane immunogenic protein
MGLAAAADLPTSKGAPMAPAYTPAFTWTGFYIGLNAGYAFGQGGSSSYYPATGGFGGLGALSPFGSYNTKTEGFTGGGQIGYNWQTGNVILGVEADINYVDGKKTDSRAFSIVGVSTLASLRSELNYLGTVRARLGYAAMPNLMLYLTGGLAYGDVSNSSVWAFNLAGAPGFYGSSSSTKVGWTVGAGAEYGFTRNITAKLEYLYYDLGSSSHLGTPNFAAGAGLATGASFTNKGSIVRAGINYKFDFGGSSVVAKY